LVKVSLNMRAGEMRVERGGPDLLDASFHYSRNLAHPVARYNVEDRVGRLTVEAPAGPERLTGHTVNEWLLRFGDKTPLEFDVRPGAGESTLELADLPIRRVEVHVGAGKLTLNLGASDRDMDVDVTGGV